jgi:hypothetical protein
MSGDLVRKSPLNFCSLPLNFNLKFSETSKKHKEKKERFFLEGFLYSINSGPIFTVNFFFYQLR